MYGNHHVINSACECVRPPLDGKELLGINEKLQQNVIITGLADILITMFFVKLSLFDNIAIMYLDIK